MSLDRLQTIEANLVSTLALVRGMIADHQEPSEIAVDEFDEGLVADGGQDENFRTIYEAIYDAILINGPLTLNEIVAETKRFSWLQINRQARTAKDSLVARGVMVFEESPKPGRLMIAPNFPVDGDPNPPLDRYIAEIEAADNGRSWPQRIEVFAEFYRLFTQRVLWREHGGAPYRAGYIVKSVAARGVMGFVEHSLTRDDNAGLMNCKKAGRPDASLEWMVCKHRDLFGHKLYPVALQRLIAAGIDVTPLTAADAT